MVDFVFKSLLDIIILFGSVFIKTLISAQKLNNFRQICIVLSPHGTLGNESKTNQTVGKCFVSL